MSVSRRKWSQVEQTKRKLVATLIEFFYNLASTRRLTLTSDTPYILLIIFTNMISDHWHSQITKAHRPAIPAAIIGFSGGFIAWGNLLAIPYLGPGWASFFTILAMLTTTTTTWLLWMLFIARHKPMLRT